MNAGAESCELTHGGVLPTTILVDKSWAIELTLTDSTASVTTTSEDFSARTDLDSSNYTIFSERIIEEPNTAADHNSNYVRKPIFHCMQMAVDEAGAAAGWLCRSQSLADDDSFLALASESNDDVDELFDSSWSFDGSFNEDKHGTKHRAAKVPEIADFSIILGGSFSSVTSGDETDTICNPPRQKSSRQTERRVTCHSTATSNILPTNCHRSLVVSRIGDNTLQELTTSRKRYCDFVQQKLMPTLSLMVKEYMQMCSSQSMASRMFAPPTRYVERQDSFPHRLLTYEIPPSIVSPRIKPFSPFVGEFGTFGTCYNHASPRIRIDSRQSLHAICNLAKASNQKIIPMLIMPSPYKGLPMICGSIKLEDAANTSSHAKQKPDSVEVVTIARPDPINAMSTSVDRYFQTRPETKLDCETSIMLAYGEAKLWSDDELKEIMCSSTKIAFDSLSDMITVSEDHSLKTCELKYELSDDGLDSEMNALGTISEKLRRELDDTVMIPSLHADPPSFSSSKRRLNDMLVSEFCQLEMDELRSAAMECWLELHEWTIFCAGK